MSATARSEKREGGHNVSFGDALAFPGFRTHSQGGKIMQEKGNRSVLLQQTYVGNCTAFGSSSCTKMKNSARALLASVRGGHGQGTRDAEIVLKVCDGF